MNILALDLGTTTGYCCEHVYGTQVFDVKRGESPGMRFLRLRKWLDEIVQLAGPIDLIVYEQAHHRGGAATACCVGMVSHVLSFAADKEIDVMPVHTATLKKWATGSGRAGKPEMIAAAKAKGYDPDDDNDADACLLYAYGQATILPEGEGR